LVISFRSTQGSVSILVLVAACASPANNSPCPRHEAAFRVQLTAPAPRAPIPPDTAIMVEYQGSESETFALGRPVHNQDVCCRLGLSTNGALPDVPCPGSTPVEAGSGSDAASPLPTGGQRDGGDGAPKGAPQPTALFCELWTNGPASVHVTASGYAVMDRDLESKLRDDNCGVRTVDVDLVLVRPDGGSP
jgi:hypothetical protein